MTQKILTTQDRLGQIFADNKACKNPDCACCVHWSATVYRLLTMLGTVLDTLQTTVDAKSGLLQEMADIKTVAALVRQLQHAVFPDTHLREKTRRCPE